MARLDLTALAKFQSKVVQDENYAKEAGVIDFFKHHSPACPILQDPDLVKQIALNNTRSISIPAIKDSSIVTTSVESFTIPANRSESEEITVSFISIWSGYRIEPYQFGDNVVKRDAYEQLKIKEVLQAMQDVKESYLLTHLNNNKTQILPSLTQINNDSGVWTFNTGTDTLDIDKAAQQNMFYGNLKTAFRLNNRKDPISILVNEGGLNLVDNTISKLGQANASNQQNGRNSIPMVFESLNISAGADQMSGYAATLGAVGIVQNHPAEFINFESVGEKQWGVTPMEMPYVKAKLNVYRNKEAADNSALGGTNANSRMSVYEEYGFLDKFCLVTRYNSDPATKVGNIVKLKGATT